MISHGCDSIARSNNIMITIVENFITKQECKKFIKMVSHLKLPDDADFENEYKPYWEYRQIDITNNPIIGKVSNYFYKHLNRRLIIKQAQIQIWIVLIVYYIRMMKMVEVGKTHIGIH